MLYQKGAQKIEVIVRKDGGGFPAGTKTMGTDETTGKNESAGGGIWGTTSPSRKARIIKTNATHALALTKQVADLGIEYYISGIGARSGDQAVQEQAARTYEVVKDVSNVASSVGIGALYGSWGGPIGAVLGATFGAISTGVSLAVKYSNRDREFRVKQLKESNAIEYKRARANINLTTGRLR